VVFSGTPVSPTNATDYHDIIEILLTLALNYGYRKNMFYFQNRKCMKQMSKAGIQNKGQYVYII